MASTRRSMPVALLGSILWWMIWPVITFFIAPIVIVTSIFSTMSAYKVALYWSSFSVWSMTILCGLKYQVEGRENIPDYAGFIIMSKHQSTWETLALSYILPPHLWVFKRELLWIPFFGWALWSIRPIAINRSSAVSSLEQVIEQSTRRMAQGMNIMIFPEGTRVTAGTKKRYKTGGSLLAEKTGKPILPVAHNAGHFWPRGGFIKQAGLITVRIGPLITTSDKSAEEINFEIENWIETQQAELDKDAVTQLADN